ncbi:anti-sigma factor [Neorhizobium lilium]|uniref:Anti-sigma factor n=1 Tax=Neorhizobium lilium TaxID=2503024 RepID=A0A3S3TUV8_9HYPH|nr:anti-sigma factor [Neorhizobium lilium]RWX75434.1 anti-sigma factor [Neorhizobium lilium]
MTSSEQNQGGRAQDEILAGEYVLGVLPLEARRRVEQRMVTDRAFARIVNRWQADIAALKDDHVEGLPTQVRLRHRERQPVALKTPVPFQLKGLWNSVSVWRCLALGAVAIAVAALLPNIISAPAPQRQPPRLAELSAAGSQINLLASYERSSGHLRLAPVASGLPEEKALQLWLVATDGRQQSLGMLGRGSNGEIDVPVELQGKLRLGGTLAVSLEPLGGSPTGAPTGPVVASGPVQGF